jgi:hypothetical protein
MLKHEHEINLRRHGTNYKADTDCTRNPNVMQKKMLLLDPNTPTPNS